MRQFESRLNRLLQWTLALLMATIVSIVVALVVLRYLFNSSIPGANELATFLFVYMTALGAAVVVGQQEHIAIPLFVELLPSRGQRFVNGVSVVCVAVLNSAMIACSLGWISVTGGYLMPSTGLPRIVAQLSVPLGCGLALVYCVLRLWHPEPYREPLDRIGDEDELTSQVQEQRESDQSGRRDS